MYIPAEPKPIFTDLDNDRQESLVCPAIYVCTVGGAQDVFATLASPASIPRHGRISRCQRSYDQNCAQLSYPNRMPDRSVFSLAKFCKPSLIRFPTYDRIHKVGRTVGAHSVS